MAEILPGSLSVVRPAASGEGAFETFVKITADGTVTADDGRKQIKGLASAAAGLSGQRVRSMVAGRLGRPPGSAELVVVPGDTARLAWMRLGQVPIKEDAMKALVYHGPGQRSWDEVPYPLLRADGDVIVKISSSTI